MWQYLPVFFFQAGTDLCQLCCVKIRRCISYLLKTVVFRRVTRHSLCPPSSSVSNDKVVLWCGCHTDRVNESAKAETSAKVSGEIQLHPRQSLIDNRLWQPALRIKWHLLDAWMVFVDCQSTTKRESEVQVGGLLLYNNYALFICRYCSLLNNINTESTYFPKLWTTSHGLFLLFLAQPSLWGKSTLDQL